MRPSSESMSVAARMAPINSTSFELARVLGQPAGPSALLADAGQAHRAALLAAEAGAGDAPVAQPGGIAVDRAAVPAVGAGDLDGQLVAGEVAERRAGGRQGHLLSNGMPFGPRQLPARGGVRACEDAVHGAGYAGASRNGHPERSEDSGPRTRPASSGRSAGGSRLRPP